MSYRHTVHANLPVAVWDEAYFSLLSLKMHLQSLPGWLGMDVTARERPAETVDVEVVTEWEGLETAIVWAQSVRTPDAILRSLPTPPHRVTASLGEVLS